MMIKAKANGNVIHADDEAAKILIDAGIYEKYEEPKAPKAAEPAKGRKPQK